ncbi:MAG: 6,7-dimethyl-8-ribityllumazine synthase [Candidatus Eisenbacteria bacterium]|uniref:6,7-dimethyl-8-ribityllumazine synthase n=1 Tax=Eiseniibacteriota bacterium TaxID=2212470 RepID=A0A538TJ83_UNCEI|nr:MAG: 6,7-dimethyl-8-ribityllumazine synthase [Candidatus Eisenbacteria bacterium]
MARANQPDPETTGHRFCLVAARFHEAYVQRLVEGALEVLRHQGVGEREVEVRWVPGSFELPLACRWAAASGRFDAVLALGVVLAGETEHFRLVADASSQGLMRVMLDTGVPILNGVLAARTPEQVAERTGGTRGNRGAEVALAAVQMARLRHSLEVR